MWKWLNRYRYKIEEFANKYGDNYYVVKRYSYWDMSDEGLISDHNRSSWYRSISPTSFVTIEEAEHAIQRSIWHNAIDIKNDRRKTLKRKRTIKIPPWGNT